MALTQYSGLSFPYLQRGGNFLTTSFGDPPFYFIWGGTGAGTPATSYAVSNSSTSQNFQRLLPGDRLLCIVSTRSTAIVNSMSTAGLPFTKVGSLTQGTTCRQEVWVSNPVAVVTSISDISIQLSASAVSLARVYLVKNAASFTVDTASGNNAFPFITGSAEAAANTLLFSVMSTDVFQPTLPASFINPATAALDVEALGFATPDIYQCALYGHSEGVGIQSTAEYNLSGTANWVIMQIQVNGPTVTLDDMNYQLRDEVGAVLLNNFTGLPIFDIDDISGLNDSTTVSTNEAIDGTDGSYVNAKFLSGKTVVIDGTMYANPPLDEVFIDTLKKNWRPASSAEANGAPLFYKVTNNPLRVLYVKPLSVVSAIDRSHTLGQIPYQLQAASQDARSYGIPNSGAIFVSGGISNVFITPLGNVETGIKIVFNKYSYDTSAIANDAFIIQLYTDLGGLVGEIAIASNTVKNIPNGIYVLDVGARTLSLLDPITGAPTDYSGYIIERNWFMLQPGVANQVIFNRPAGSAIDGSVGASYVYSDAWR